MDDTKRHSNGQGEAMELTDIESLIQQVDVMVGVGDISPFPETEFSETDDATEQ